MRFIGSLPSKSENKIDTQAVQLDALAIDSRVQIDEVRAVEFAADMLDLRLQGDVLHRIPAHSQCHRILVTCAVGSIHSGFQWCQFRYLGKWQSLCTAVLL